MKIGILTLWLGVDNYGQQLQIYALQKYLRNNGHDAYLIRYAYQTDILYTSEKNKLSKKGWFTSNVKNISEIFS